MSGYLTNKLIVYVIWLMFDVSNCNLLQLPEDGLLSFLNQVGGFVGCTI